MKPPISKERQQLLECIRQMADRATELGEFDIASLLYGVTISVMDNTTDELADIMEQFQQIQDVVKTMEKKSSLDPKSPGDSPKWN